MPIDLDREARKSLLKEAMKEWLDDRWNRSTASFGQWVLRLLAVALFIAAVRLAIRTHGWIDD